MCSFTLCNGLFKALTNIYSISFKHSVISQLWTFDALQNELLRKLIRVRWLSAPSFSTLLWIVVKCLITNESVKFSFVLGLWHKLLIELIKQFRQHRLGEIDWLLIFSSNALRLEQKRIRELISTHYASFRISRVTSKRFNDLVASHVALML